VQIFSPIFGPIGYIFELIFTYPIFNVLMLLYHLFGDFALSIIVMTILIRLVLYPLTLQQLKSSKATQAIQPQIAEIRKKYAKDPKKQQEEMSALYKASGVNPLAGCLPLLIQLPVLYGLFYALNTVLRNPVLHNAQGTGINDLIYPWLPHFAKLPVLDLNWFTFLNPAWHISLGHPDPTHILPIVAGIMTFIQLRMSQPKTASTSKDPMTQQMQMMQFLMPAITIFIGWGLAAGLAVYWTTTSLFSAVQQYFVTGWGQLLNPINLAGLLGGSTSNTSNTTGSKKNYTGDQRKERSHDKSGTYTGDEPEADGDISDGPVGRNLRTTSHVNGSSSGRRRPRGASSSARRRGNTSNRSRR
jgi:YidC/Oxa1 family membrane protein insertase